ncbi:PhnA domain-containing protein [Dongshaea marina]|uniref:PhnA domain-containing protein n=1 Tax=Dongshaea marina TaxID=2047966 RepID=UPI000D3E21AD|nr:alkylphosphonate utilization protein [Dongshaea marina]
MNIQQTLEQRSSNQCELCGSDSGLSVFEVGPQSDGSVEQAVLLCETCRSQLENPQSLDLNHWRCLNDSMWSQVPAVQVMAYRQLKHLSATENWAQDLLEMLYLEDEVKSWADAGLSEQDEETAATLDCNGTLLQAGDSVTITKDLVVKGAGFTAKRGTAVRNISLCANPEHIEGRVNGTRVVLLSCYMKKSN